VAGRLLDGIARGLGTLLTQAWTESLGGAQRPFGNRAVSLRLDTVVAGWRGMWPPATGLRCRRIARSTVGE